MQEIEEGAVFDVALLPRSAIDQLDGARQDRPRHGARRRTSLVGLMVRRRAAAPTSLPSSAQNRAAPAAVALLQQRSERLLRRGAVASPRFVTVMQDKTVFAMAASSAKSRQWQAEIGMHPIIESAPVAGAQLVGPLPRGADELRASIRPASRFGTHARALFVRSSPRPKRSHHPRQGHGAGLIGRPHLRRSAARCRGCACAIALLCPYRLDFDR